jgi:hypothetical protein
LVRVQIEETSTLRVQIEETSRNEQALQNASNVALTMKSEPFANSLIITRI